VNKDRPMYVCTGYVCNLHYHPTKYYGCIMTIITTYIIVKELLTHNNIQSRTRHAEFYKVLQAGIYSIRLRMIDQPSNVTHTSVRATPKSHYSYSL
jgi:hypothetical protein